MLGKKGAERVIAVDYIDYRLRHAKRMSGVEVFDFTEDPDMGETLKELTKGGADVVIDCVGMDGKKSPLEKKLSKNSSCKAERSDPFKLPQKPFANVEQCR
ncbi:hypothetical protein BsIDN1_04600 [Bacillus safensis]|uniref:Alcohol dehydrogenase-like C-terminal domain-containing protein n=1 Tax=Bacillus safensis TaxID=561879 RepID=A0A5S9M292_BACIA|nr:hypothetical protein BsIDN1_04600 [Bacillus safensis]